MIHVTYHPHSIASPDQANSSQAKPSQAKPSQARLGWSGGKSSSRPQSGHTLNASFPGLLQRLCQHLCLRPNPRSPRSQRVVAISFKPKLALWHMRSPSSSPASSPSSSSSVAASVDVLHQWLSTMLSAFVLANCSLHSQTLATL